MRFRILLAEDNPGDVLLFREALKGSGMQFELVVAEDGERAIRLIQDANAKSVEDVFHLIVLDMNLPRYDGTSVLREVRDSPKTNTTPVAVFTSSDSPDDHRQAETLGAIYIRKPMDLEAYLAIGPRLRELLNKEPGIHLIAPEAG